MAETGFGKIDIRFAKNNQHNEISLAFELLKIILPSNVVINSSYKTIQDFHSYTHTREYLTNYHIYNFTTSTHIHSRIVCINACRIAWRTRIVDATIERDRICSICDSGGQNQAQPYTHTITIAKCLQLRGQCAEPYSVLTQYTLRRVCTHTSHYWATLY